MRWTKYYLPTLKEVPSEAEIISHILMFRAGMIRKVSSGIYSYLPLGLRVIRKVENIIREEMNKKGAIEVFLPSVQPAELWKESGRWDYYGPELLRFKDRHNRDYCLGPTHEEVITDLVRNEVRSYRQLPLNLYQIQTKFRDEIRPRFGVMRAREFSMKDAYSFDLDETSAEISYQKMYDAYTRIFKRCGFNFRAVEADTGAIGGSFSHEFMVLAETGENVIVSCKSCGYAANIEMAKVMPPEKKNPSDQKQKPLEKVKTPNKTTVEQVTAFLGVKPANLVKTIIFNSDKGVIAALVRGDHEINMVKLKNYLKAEWIELADEATVEKVTNAPKGFAGPVGLDIRIIADHAIGSLSNFVTGANEADAHFINVNYDRDFPLKEITDLRFITPSDRCPECGGEIQFSRGIEVGQVFKLGTKYSKAMHATYLDAQGKEKLMVMGCYGIGVGRTVAAAIEQHHDKDGIIFPVTIAPFEVIITPVNIKNKEIKDVSEKLYGELTKDEVEVLLDDRDERPGVKFKDADLIGIPFRITIGEKNLKNGIIEIMIRKNRETLLEKIENGAKKVEELIEKEKLSLMP